MMPSHDESGAGNAHYDALIIGCGMSGLGAGIRLAMFGKRVLIVERHNAPGGLNGYYFKGARKLDVGLHAMTNFAPPNVKGPLSKLYRQLRIKPEQFALCPQLGSRIVFPGEQLRFGNTLELLESDICRAFPARIDAFRRLVAMVETYDALDISRPSPGMARRLVHEALGDPLLAEMILCPLFFYGSAQQDDIDMDQFCILFRALYMEGFARPLEGVRRIVRVLLERYREVGGQRRMKCGARRLVERGGRVVEAELDDGTCVSADTVISSIGADETQALFGGARAESAELPRQSFAEHIACLSVQPRDLGWNDTIVFFNDSERVDYRIPQSLVDTKSGVICFPNNYDYGAQSMDEGMLRVTALANYDRWNALPQERYEAEKGACANRMLDNALRHLPGGVAALSDNAVTFRDTFTPLTIERFTGHIRGGVYGLPDKLRDGRTSCGNLFLCGTDQGFLGIVGAILGGISMANMHVLSRS
jgi:phytoene dehydrogenase-like protein